MHRNIIIGLLLSGCISSIVTSEIVTTSETHVSTKEAGLATPGTHSTALRAAEQSVTRRHPDTGQEQTEARKQVEHAFSEAVITVIIFGVMASIITVILLLVYGVRKLRERSSVNVQSAIPQNTDDPLSSIETGNPVFPQNNNE